MSLTEKICVPKIKTATRRTETKETKGPVTLRGIAVSVVHYVRLEFRMVF